MRSYLDYISKVLYAGSRRPTRTDIDALSLFGPSAWEHNMELGLPILTTKKINIKACIHELLWFLRGETNIKYLNDNGVHIWDPWADENGELGPVYGAQWIKSGPRKINQVEQLIHDINTNPYSRRLIIDAWNPSDMQDMALPPCHILYQFYADPDKEKLSLQVYMRSADLFLGVPFDIAEGGLLLSMVAAVTGYEPYRLRYTFGDLHIYANHIDQVLIQKERKPLPLPTLELPKKSSIFDYTFDDFKILNYQHHPAIKGDIAV